MRHRVAAMQVLWGLGLACVLASGLIPAFSLRGDTGYASVHCELGVWRTKCSASVLMSASDAPGSSDTKTYDVPLLQAEWVVPAMAVTYTATLILGIATVVLQLAAAPKAACLRAKELGLHYCESALHFFTMVLGIAYPISVDNYARNSWVSHKEGRWQLLSQPSNNSFNMYVKPGFVVACAGAAFLITSPFAGANCRQWCRRAPPSAPQSSGHGGPLSHIDTLVRE